MKRSFLLLFSLLFISPFTLAQNKLEQDKARDLFSHAQDKVAKSSMVDTWKPLQYRPQGGFIFMDDMNGVNDLAGITARGWLFDDVDGAGATTVFQGNPGVLVAYEGPDSGYLGQNFNGAFAGGLLIDQWLISPEVTVASGDVLQFWHRTPDGSIFPDPLEVWVSNTAGTTAADFDVQLDAFLGSTTGWAQWVGNFPSSGTVRFAVRYYTTNGGPGGAESNYVGLDLFEVLPPCFIDPATNPSPPDGAINIPIAGNTATWTNGAGADSICVYFGELGNLQLVYDGAPITSVSLAGVEPLNYSTQYGWQVVGKNDSCQVPGPVWDFTTIPCPVGIPAAPSPSDGVTGVPISGNTAMWTNGANTTMNRVYFGTPGSLTLVYDGAAITSLSLAGVEPLAYSTAYAWQVVCVNPDCETSGPEWTFTTERDPNIVCAFMDDFTDTTNWSAVNINDPCDWNYSTGAILPGSWGTPPSFPPTADSFYVYASSDWCGGVMNVYLNGNFTVDASLYQSVWIEFDSDMEVFGAPVPEDTAAVDVSIDGGTSWTRVFLRQVDTPSEQAVVDISSLAGLQGDIRFRLCYYGDFSWHWALDNFGVYLDGFIPVELTSFAATVNEYEVNLSWSTATELNNHGFEIERRSEGEFRTIGFVQGNGTTTEIQNYSFTDSDVDVGNYSYRLKQVDFNGVHEYSNVIEVDVIAPDVYALEQNYPNPFNPNTKIKFSLAAESVVSLTVFDILGQEVITLINGNLSAGAHDIDFNASNLNSGVYFYRIDATGVDGTNFTSVMKMILTK